MPSALDAILEYYKVFSTLDVSAIVSYFCEPSMTIAPQAMFTAANRSALADSLAPLIHSLKAKGLRPERVRPGRGYGARRDRCSRTGRCRTVCDDGIRIGTDPAH